MVITTLDVHKYQHVSSLSLQTIISSPVIALPSHGGQFCVQDVSGFVYELLGSVVVLLVQGKHSAVEGRVVGGTRDVREVSLHVFPLACGRGKRSVVYNACKKGIHTKGFLKPTYQNLSGQTI